MGHKRSPSQPAPRTGYKHSCLCEPKCKSSFAYLRAFPCCIRSCQGIYTLKKNTSNFDLFTSVWRLPLLKTPVQQSSHPCPQSKTSGLHILDEKIKMAHSLQGNGYIGRGSKTLFSTCKNQCCVSFMLF